METPADTNTDESPAEKCLRLLEQFSYHAGKLAAVLESLGNSDAAEAAQRAANEAGADAARAQCVGLGKSVPHAGSRLVQ